jgi:uncharacterized membrane-anchored protein YitT (DUF2179 family)
MTRKHIWDYFLITVGTFLMAYAVIGFWRPFSLVTGGISGLGIVIESVTNGRIPVWLTNIVGNVPLFIIGWKTIRREYFVRSLYVVVIFTFGLAWVELLPHPPADIFTAAVFGGVVGGIGLGLIFRTMATTGGSTLAATILHQKVFKQISLPKILFMVDSTIIITGLLVFGVLETMYAIVAVFICTKITDIMLEGVSFAKGAFIISKDSQAIADAILLTMRRGVTGIPSVGMYSKSPQDMLMCVVDTKQLVALKELVHSIDERAFVIVTDVREVLGEGFTLEQTINNADYTA